MSLEETRKYKKAQMCLYENSSPVLAQGSILIDSNLAAAGVYSI